MDDEQFFFDKILSDFAMYYIMENPGKIIYYTVFCLFNQRNKLVFFMKPDFFASEESDYLFFLRIYVNTFKAS